MTFDPDASAAKAHEKAMAEFRRQELERAVRQGNLVRIQQEQEVERLAREAARANREGKG